MYGSVLQKKPKKMTGLFVHVMTRFEVDHVRFLPGSRIDMRDFSTCWLVRGQPCECSSGHVPRLAEFERAEGQCSLHGVCRASLTTTNHSVVRSIDYTHHMSAFSVSSNIRHRQKEESRLHCNSQPRRSSFPVSNILSSA